MVLQVFEETWVSAPLLEIWSVKAIIDNKPSSKAIELVIVKDAIAKWGEVAFCVQ